MNEDVKMLVKCSFPLAMLMAEYQITAGEYGAPDGTGRLKMAFSMKKCGMLIVCSGMTRC